MKAVWGGLVVLALAAPASAQTVEETLRTLRQQYPAERLTKEQLSELLNAAAWKHKSEGWGLLEKPSGNNCPYGPGSTVIRISCDILMHKPSGRIFDVLADQEGAARVVWGEAHGSPLPIARWLGPVGSDALPSPAPDPTPTPTEPPADQPADLLTLILERFSAIEERLLAVEAAAQRTEVNAQAVVTATEEVRDQLRELAARPWPEYTGRIFGQPFTLRPR